MSAHYFEIPQGFNGANPPKEKYSVNKKNRVNLLENLYGWLGVGVKFMV